MTHSCAYLSTLLTKKCIHEQALLLLYFAIVTTSAMPSWLTGIRDSHLFNTHTRGQTVMVSNMSALLPRSICNTQVPQPVDLSCDHQPHPKSTSLAIRPGTTDSENTSRALLCSLSKTFAESVQGNQMFTAYFSWFPSKPLQVFVPVPINSSSVPNAVMGRPKQLGVWWQICAKFIAPVFLVPAEWAARRFRPQVRKCNTLRHCLV